MPILVEVQPAVGWFPAANVWYAFRIEVEDTGSQTNIRARVWEAGTTEPATWQIDMYDSSGSRRTAGTVGVWSHAFGNKYWDDLVVAEITPPGPHTLTVNSSGSGSVAADPDLTDYTHNSSVTLTATAQAGWTFVNWTGDLSGSDNPATVVMDDNKVITAVFAEDIPQTLTTNTVGNGTLLVNPNQAQYSLGDNVTVTAVPDSGYIFTGWSGDLTGTTNPAVIMMDSNKTITATFDVQPPGLLNENFNIYGPDADPADWQDTGANNSMIEDDALFAVAYVGGDAALSTSSTLNNIHTHYQGAGAATATNYVYSGRMMIENQTAGIGVTFFSDYNQTDSYYRLRRYGSNSFHISPHGTSITGGTVSSNIVPTAKRLV